jgi:hypothetical protein
MNGPGMSGERPVYTGLSIEERENYTDSARKAALQLSSAAIRVGAPPVDLRTALDALFGEETDLCRKKK